jgi:hypothetical protein
LVGTGDGEPVWGEWVVHGERDEKEEDPPVYGESPWLVPCRHQPTVSKKVKWGARRRRWTYCMCPVYRAHGGRLPLVHVIARRTRAPR